MGVVSLTRTVDVGTDKDQAPTLVILLEDLEAIDGKVLNQLISTISYVLFQLSSHDSKLTLASSPVTSRPLYH